MSKIVHDIIALLQSWWQTDRVRVSPEEGALLRIAPGTIVVLRGQVLEVVERREERRADSIVLRFHCSSAANHSELAVRYNRSGQTTLEWYEDGKCHELDRFELEIFEAPQQARKPVAT